MVRHLLLLPSPMLPATAYDRLALALEQAGARVQVARTAADQAPDAESLVRSWAPLLTPATTIVAHSNAGYLAPSVRCRAGGGAEAGVVFMDAALPPESGSAPLAPARFRDQLVGLADDDGVLPPWTRWWSREDLDGVVPPDDLDELDRTCPRVPSSYFDGRAVAPQGWVDAPHGYLAFGATYAEELAFAQQHGWPHAVLTGAHLHFLFDPDAVAAAVLDLADQLPGGRGG